MDVRLMIEQQPFKVIERVLIQAEALLTRLEPNLHSQSAESL
jgi:hypothetical protein